MQHDLSAEHQRQLQLSSLFTIVQAAIVETLRYRQSDPYSSPHRAGLSFIACELAPDVAAALDRALDDNNRGFQAGQLVVFKQLASQLSLKHARGQEPERVVLEFNPMKFNDRMTLARLGVQMPIVLEAGETPLEIKNAGALMPYDHDGVARVRVTDNGACYRSETGKVEVTVSCLRTGLAILDLLDRHERGQRLTEMPAKPIDVRPADLPRPTVGPSLVNRPHFVPLGVH